MGHTKKLLSGLVIVLMMFLMVGTGLAASKVTIRFQDWRLAEKPAGPCLEEMVKAFEKQNPDIKVILDPVSVNDKLTKFVTQSRGGDPPDVVRILTTDVPGFVEMGLLRPLDDLVEKAGGKTFLKDFTPYLVKAMTIKGKLYGIPHEGDALVIYYNTDMFRKAGLDPNSPPQTWDEFLAASKKLTNPAEGHWAFGMLASPAIASIWMQSWFLANGSNFFNEDYTDTLIDSPAGIEAFKYYVELYTKHGVVPPGPTDVDYAAQVNLFAQQKVAMIVGPFATYGGIFAANPELKGKVKMMQFPGKVKASSGRGTVFAIASASKHPDAAWELIEFLNSPANQLKFFREATMMPTRQSVFASKEISGNPELAVMLKAMSTAVSYPIYHRWAEADRELVNALHAALLKVKTPEQAAKDAGVAIRALMKK
ncbi:MAG TPA: sugar ABC transporter substrate-binding protein [Firmicutes bacterium]|nr:sugar ABC transporter substrate-binding protein [Bacillota bacterium]